MNLVCLGCQSIPRTISCNDFTEGSCGVDQQDQPRPIGPSKLVRGSSKKIKNDRKSNKERSFKRKEINKPRLMRSCGMRRDWSLEDTRRLMNTASKEKVCI